MANPFDFNASADNALMGGGSASSALGFPKAPARIGLTPPLATAAAPAPAQPTPQQRYDQSLQAVQQAAPQQNTQQEEPRVGYNPSNNSFFSDGRVFSLDNLSEANAADSAGYLGFHNTDLPPGYLPAAASQIRQKIERDSNDRGFFSAAKEVGKQAVNSVYTGVPSTLNKAGAFFSPDGSAAEKGFTEAYKHWDDVAAKPEWAPDLYGRGIAAESLIKGAGSLGPSLLAMGATVANPLLGAAVSTAAFGGSTAQDTYTKALAAGKSQDEARNLGIQTGAVSGVGEAISNVVGTKLLQGAGTIGKTLMRGGDAAAIAAAKSPKFIAGAVGDVAANALIEGGTEAAQNAGVAAIEKNAGLKTDSPMDSAIEGLKAGIGMSILLAPIGIYGGKRAANQRTAIERVLADDKSSPAARALAADRRQEMYTESMGRAKAEAWRAGFNKGEADIAAAATEARITRPVGEGPTTDMFSGELGAATPAPTSALPTLAPKDTRTIDMLMPDESPAPLQQVETNATGIPGVGINNSGVYTAAPAQPVAPVGRVMPRVTADPTAQGALQQVETGDTPVSESELAAFNAALSGSTKPTEVLPAVPPANAVAAEAPAANPAGDFLTREQLDTAYPTRKDAAAAATLSGITVRARDNRSAILDKMAKGAAPATPAQPTQVVTKPAPVAPAPKPAPVAEPAAADVQAELDGLEASRKSDAGKVQGKVTITSAELADIPKGGSIKDSVMEILRLAKKQYNSVSNDVPTPSRAKLKGDADVEAKAAAEKVGSRRRDTQEKLYAAVKKFADAAGSDANSNAVIASLKKAVQEMDGTEFDKLKTGMSADVLLSRVWKDYVDGVLGDPSNLVQTRSGEIRNSKEIQKAGDPTEPLMDAATNGYTSRDVSRQKGETDEAYAARVVKLKAESKGLLGVINYLRTGTAYEATLASAIGRALRAAGIKPSVSFDLKVGENPYYDPKTDTVHISSTASSEVILHEALHAALQWYVTTHPNHASVLALKNALQQVLAADRSSLSPKAQEVFDTLAAVNKRSKTDAVLELISYGATLREFTKALTTIPSTAKNTGLINAISHLFKRISALMQNYLGVNSTVANDVLEHTIKLLEEATDAAAQRPAPGKGKGNILKADTVSAVGPIVHDSNEAVTEVPDYTPLAIKQAFNAGAVSAILHTPQTAAWVLKNSSKAAELGRKNFPGVAGAASLIAPRINVSDNVSSLIDQHKLDSSVPEGFANRFAGYITNARPEDALAMFNYLDNRAGADKVPDYIRALADDLRSSIETMLADIRDPTVAAYLKGYKISEMLVFPNSVNQVVSNSFGAHRSKSLLGTAIAHEQSIDNVISPLDAVGDPVLDGKFYRTYELLAGTSEPVPVGFAGTDTVSVDRARNAGVTVDTSTVYTYTGKETAKGSQHFGEFKFRAGLTVEKALAPVAGEETASARDRRVERTAAALQNFVAILARNTAANRFTDEMATLGAAEGTLHDSVASINKWLGEDSPPVLQQNVLEWSKGEANASSVRRLYRNPNQWIYIPDSAVYGAMRGKYVQGSMWMAIQDATTREPFFNSPAMQNIMRVFKQAVTKYNMPTWITNVGTNLTLAYLHDIPRSAVIAAGKMYAKYEVSPGSLSEVEREMMRQVHKSGAMLQSFSTTEIKQSLYESLIANASEGQPSMWNTLKGMMGTEQSIQKRGIDIAKKTGRKVDDVFSEFYAAQDNVFRVAAFLAKTGELQMALKPGEKLTQTQYDIAGAFAKKAFLDYDTDSRAVNMLRQTVLPFVSWTYAIIPVLGNIALHKPWKLMNLAAGYAAIEAVSRAVSGDSGDEDERKRAIGGKAMQQRLFGFGPHAFLRVPGMGTDEKPVYYKLGNFIPMGDFLNTSPNGFFGQTGWAGAFTPNGPLVTVMAAAVFGTDPYTGKPIGKVTNTDLENLVERAKFLQSSITPHYPGINAKETEKLAKLDQRGPLGHEASTSLQIARWMGLRLQDVDLAEAEVIRSRAGKAIMHEFKVELNKERRAAMLNIDSDEKLKEFAKTRAVLTARMKDRIAAAKGNEDGPVNEDAASAAQD